MVITCTASASDSRRRVRSSSSASRSASWMRRPSQVARAVGPRPSDTPASCSSWATWRRSVMKRSPDGRASTRAGTPCELLTVSNSAATPWSRSSAAQRCSDQCRSSHSSSPAVATSSARPADEAGERGQRRPVPRRRALERLEQAQPLAAPARSRRPSPAPPITAGTPAACSASRTSHGLAVGPHQHGDVARVHGGARARCRRADA